MCVTSQVHITPDTPVALATPYATAQCITQTSDLTHPVISLMTYTGDDIEWVIRVTSTPLRGVND